MWCYKISCMHVVVTNAQTQWNASSLREHTHSKEALIRKSKHSCSLFHIHTHTHTNTLSLTHTDARKHTTHPQLSHTPQLTHTHTHTKHHTQHHTLLIPSMWKYGRGDRKRESAHDGYSRFSSRAGMWLYKRQQLLVIKEYVRCPSLQRESERERETQVRAWERGRVTWELLVPTYLSTRSPTIDNLWSTVASLWVELALAKKNATLASPVCLHAFLPRSLSHTLMGDDGDNSILLRLSFVKLFPKLRPQDFQYSRKIHEPIISRFQASEVRKSGLHRGEDDARTSLKHQHASSPYRICGPSPRHLRRCLFR